MSSKTQVYSLAARAVEDSFYVDDGLTGADSVEEAVELHIQLQSLFGKAEFLLCKWNSSELEVLQHIDSELRDQRAICTFSDPDEYTKTLGVEWNARLDHFRLSQIYPLIEIQPSMPLPLTLPGSLIFWAGLLLLPSRQRSSYSIYGRKARDSSNNTGASVARVEERAPSACWQTHPTVLLLQGGPCGTQATAWVLRCF